MCAKVKPMLSFSLKKLCLLLSYLYQNVISFSKNLFEHTDASSLAFFRISFGLLMTIDVIEEREFSDLEEKYLNKAICYFPLMNSIPVFPYEWMCLIYFIMWLGAIGIMLGYKFYHSCTMFIIPFWYLILLHKENWNHHTYMFGIFAVLLFCTEANVCWSLDAYRLPKTLEKNLDDPPSVPMWNYFILRFQVFILYFMAGVKKINYDWLSGYSVTDLAHHWVFDPFKFFLSVEFIDLWIVHRFGFFLDMVSGFGLCFNLTRPITLFFLLFFHGMNSRMFRIGMFPYSGIATMFVLCGTSWPRKLLWGICSKITLLNPYIIKLSHIYVKNTEKKNPITWCHKFKVFSLIFFHMSMQFFLPFSHFLTKGYNRWVEGQYGYNWDMMVNVWDIYSLALIVKDKDTNTRYFLDTEVLTGGDTRWARHPDMVKQFSTCANKILAKSRSFGGKNVSLHIDMWMALNGRIHQRVYDPNVDLLVAEWSPWQDTPWLMPLLDQFSSWRPLIHKMKRKLQKPLRGRDADFFLDFPGYTKETFIEADVFNVKLTVLKGTVKILDNNITLHNGQTAKLDNKKFVHILTISSEPSCYYISYRFKPDQEDEKKTEEEEEEKEEEEEDVVNDDYFGDRKQRKNMNLIVRYFIGVFKALRSFTKGLTIIFLKYTNR